MNLHDTARLSPVRILASSAALLLLAAGLVVASAGAIGASVDGCGEYSFGFTGTRLIHDGTSDSAGPFSIDLPAGTYDITMWSGDNHPTADYQVEQTNEQWYFLLDNGYQSPPTIDIPANGTATTTAVSQVSLEAATAISVHHIGIGGVNSVNVECVGFTPSVIATPTTVPTEVEVAGPPATTTPVAVPPTTETVTVEVQAVVELPQAQLAVTGPQSTPMIVIGLLMLVVGAFCLVAERRTDQI